MEKKVRVISVIHNTFETRGDGKDIPTRTVVGIYDHSGGKIAEDDPYNFTLEQIREAYYKHEFRLFDDFVKILLNTKSNKVQ